MDPNIFFFSKTKKKFKRRVRKCLQIAELLPVLLCLCQEVTCPHLAAACSLFPPN